VGTTYREQIVVGQVAVHRHGALVVGTEAWRKGSQVEAYPEDHYDQKVYAPITERVAGGERIGVAVFPSLPAGNYKVSIPYAHYATVTVFPGAVAEVDWR
jgi:hypothetical protein